MGSGSKQKSSAQQLPGTLSPVTASLLDLFGGNVIASGGQFFPTSFGQGGAFSPQSFAALPGLLQNQPLTGVEQSILGAQGGGFGGGIQGLGMQAGLQAQGLLEQGAAALPALLETNPAASIAAAQRSFKEDTLPAILERAPGFSGSDLQRELTRAGVDLQTNIAALKEANLGRVGQVVAGLPGYAQAYGQNLFDSATQALGFGQLGRQLVMENTPAGDAFRVLTALQGLTGSAITSQSGSSGKGKSTSVLA